MTQKDMVNYSRYIVNQYLRNKPELEEFRADLEQEAYMAYLEADDSWQEDRGKDFNLYAFHVIVQKLQRFTRKEAKHFRRKTVYPDDSPYWDLNEPVEVEEIPEEQDEHTAMDLRDIVGKLNLTDRQLEVLSVWLETGEHEATAKKLGVTEGYVRKIIKYVIDGGKSLVRI